MYQQPLLSEKMQIVAGAVCLSSNTLQVVEAGAADLQTHDALRTLTCAADLDPIVGEQKVYGFDERSKGNPMKPFYLEVFSIIHTARIT